MIETKIKLSEKAAAIVASVETMPQWMLRVIREGLDEQNELTIGKVQRDYLSFPKDQQTVDIGCRAISGRLRGSLRRSRARVAGGGRIVSAIGSNLVYAAAQELGFDGEVTVRPHTRKKFKLETHFGRRRMIQKADIGVRSYTREMHLTGRGFIQRGIADRAPNYSDALSQGIVDRFNKNATN